MWMAPSGSRQVRSRPWWRSSQRASADRRSAWSAGGHCARDATEPALVARAKNGGPREREELVNAYLPMIASVAYAYWRSSGLGRDELTQEGIVGLLRALERYEPQRGVPFWGYATWWVRQAMQQVVSELSRPVVLSDRALRQLARIKDAQRRFGQTRRREATAAELSAMVGLSTSQVEKLLCTDRTARGLDDLPAHEAYERVPQQVLASQIPGLLGHLTDRERAVICSRYGLGRREQTLREIAPRLGVSAERVRQIEQDSLAKLYAAVAPDQPPRRPGRTTLGARSNAQA
jgi:RNA polymerase primary sigma factor